MAYTADLCLPNKALHPAEPLYESLLTLEIWESSLFPDARGSQPGWGSWNLYSVKQDGSPAVPRRWSTQFCDFEVQSVQTVSIRVCTQRVGSPLTPSRSGCPIQCPQAQATSRGLRCGFRFLSPVLEVTQWVPSLHLLQGQSHKLVVGSQMIPAECEQCW